MGSDLAREAERLRITNGYIHARNSDKLERALKIILRLSLRIRSGHDEVTLKTISAIASTALSGLEENKKDLF